MKMMNDLLILKTLNSSTRDDSGFRTETYLEKEIFCEIKSATRSEVYEAMRNGMKVSIIAKINVEDFKGQTIIVDGKKVKPSLVKYDLSEYEIIRTYQTDDNYIELTLCEVE